MGSAHARTSDIRSGPSTHAATRPMIYRGLLFAAWIVWLAYWAVSAVRVKQIERRESVRSRLAYLLPLVIGGWLIAVSRARLGPLSVQLWTDDTARLRCGVVLVVLGLGFSI